MIITKNVSGGGWKTSTQKAETFAKFLSNNIAYTDSLSSFDALNISGFHHYWINHSKQFANQQTILTVPKTFKIRQNMSCTNTTESIANLSHCS